MGNKKKKLMKLSFCLSLLSTGKFFTGFISLLILNLYSSLSVIASGKEGNHGRYIFGKKNQKTPVGGFFSLLIWSEILCINQRSF